MAQINSETSSDESRFSIKKPKRVLHFSDGTVEEFSDSEEEITEPDTTVATVSLTCYRKMSLLV